MTEALPCVICGQYLKRVDDMSDETAPYRGTNFNSYGHYGSTVFDPMDGTFISFNLCDPCLVAAGEQQRVVCGRSSRPVVCDMPFQARPDSPVRCLRSVVGSERVDRGLVPWHRHLAPYDKDDVCVIGLDDLEQGLPDAIHLQIDAAALIQELRDYNQEDEAKQ